MRASEKAYLSVRNRILHGVYAASARITEKEIAGSTGVSRTPVREALRRLQAEGFVTVIPNQGAVVAEWTDSDTNEVFDLRALLEPYGVARAAQRITAEGVETLRRLAESQYEEAEARRTGFLLRIDDYNSRFHRTVHEISGTRRLPLLLPVLIEAPLVFKTFSTYQPADLLRSARHHIDIVEALKARDAEWSASVMRTHILAARSSALKRQGDA